MRSCIARGITNSRLTSHCLRLSDCLVNFALCDQPRCPNLYFTAIEASASLARPLPTSSILYPSRPRDVATPLYLTRTQSPKPYQPLTYPILHPTNYAKLETYSRQHLSSTVWISRVKRRLINAWWPFIERRFESHRFLRRGAVNRHGLRAEIAL